jgi:hypothetical protein
VVSFQYADKVLVLPSVSSVTSTLLSNWSSQKVYNARHKPVAVVNVRNAALFHEELALIKQHSHFDANNNVNEESHKHHDESLVVFINSESFPQIVPDLYEIKEWKPSSLPALVSFQATLPSLTATSSTLALFSHLSPYILLLAAQGDAQESHDLSYLLHEWSRAHKLPSLLLKSAPLPTASSEPYKKIVLRQPPQLHHEVKNIPLLSPIQTAKFYISTMRPIKRPLLCP